MRMTATSRQTFCYSFQSRWSVADRAEGVQVSEKRARRKAVSRNPAVSSRAETSLLFQCRERAQRGQFAFRGDGVLHFRLDLDCC